LSVALGQVPDFQDKGIIELFRHLQALQITRFYNATSTRWAIFSLYTLSQSFYQNRAILIRRFSYLDAKLCDPKNFFGTYSSTFPLVICFIKSWKIEASFSKGKSQDCWTLSIITDALNRWKLVRKPQNGDHHHSVNK
jgi:hypothetical protein